MFDSRLQDPRTVVCGLHCIVWTAPALKGQKCPHTHNFHIHSSFEPYFTKKWNFSLNN